MQKWSLFWAIGLMAFWVLASPGRAMAYLDPGTGSYLFQILIAALVGGLFAVKLFWGKIAAFFSGLFGKKQSADSEVAEDAASGKSE